MLALFASIYKMVDCVYIAGDYKSSKISTATIIKNPEMLRLVPDLYESQQMCDKAISENSGTLEFCS